MLELEDFFEEPLAAFFTAFIAFFLVFFDAKTRKRIRRIKTATPITMMAQRGIGKLSMKEEDLTVTL